MKVFVQKKGQTYRAYSPELECIRNAIFYSSSLDISGAESAIDAIEDFKFELEEFIEYYFYEHKGTPEGLPDCLNIEYIFDEDSFYNRFLADPSVWGTEGKKVNPFRAKSASKTNIEEVEAKAGNDIGIVNPPKTSFYDEMKDKECVIAHYSLSFKDGMKLINKIAQLGARPKNKIAPSTSFVVIGDKKPINKKDQDKIDELNAAGANITILPATDFLYMK